MTDTNVNEYKYGDAIMIADLTKLPVTSLQAMVRRGLSHYFGNEQASKVTAWKESYAEDHNGTAPNDAEVATYKLDCQKKALEALLAGTVGVHAPRGPKATPVDALVRQLAIREITDVLTAHKLKMPKGEETVELAGKTFTREQLVDRRITAHGERLKKAAEAELKRREREAKAAGGLEALM